MRFNRQAPGPSRVQGNSGGSSEQSFSGQIPHPAGTASTEA